MERIEKCRPGEGHSWVVVVEHTGQLHPQLLSALNSGTLKSEHNLARFGQAGAPGGFGGPARTPPFSLAQEFPANDL